eukprot:2757890-Pyramimonas_sp.AAC.1
MEAVLGASWALLEAELDQAIGPCIPRVSPRHLRGTLGGKRDGEGEGGNSRREQEIVESFLGHFWAL